MQQVFLPSKPSTKAFTKFPAIKDIEYVVSWELRIKTQLGRRRNANRHDIPFRGTTPEVGYAHISTLAVERLYYHDPKTSPSPRLGWPTSTSLPLSPPTSPKPPVHCP